MTQEFAGSPYIETVATTIALSAATSCPFKKAAAAGIRPLLLGSKDHEYSDGCHGVFAQSVGRFLDGEYPVDEHMWAISSHVDAETLHERMYWSSDKMKLDPRLIVLTPLDEQGDATLMKFNGISPVGGKDYAEPWENSAELKKISANPLPQARVEDTALRESLTHLYGEKGLFQTIATTFPWNGQKRSPIARSVRLPYAGDDFKRVADTVMGASVEGREQAGIRTEIVGEYLARREINSKNLLGKPLL